MDDAQLTELARRVQGGDAESFRLLVEGETRRLIAMAYRYTGEWETARDLCQETWLKVDRRLFSYDPERPFRAWLVAIHRNTCVSYLRSAAVRHEQPASDEELARLSPPSAGPDAEERLQAGEFVARLRTAMARLSDSQLRVFTLVDLEQLGQKQAARALEMEPSTLRTTLHFARKRLARTIRRMESSP